MSTAKVPVVVTLVHGTWGRGMFTSPTGAAPRWFEVGSNFRCRLTRLRQAMPFAKRGVTYRWFEEGSAFRKKLNLAMDKAGAAPTYHVFPWSGHNSIVERDKAAKDLAALLQQQAEEFSGQRRLVIAHSHGGNVAMRALYHLGSTSEPIWLVTLATPFIQLFLQYPESSAGQTYKRLAVLAGSTFAALGAFGLFLQAGSMAGERSTLLAGLYVSLAFFGLFGTPWFLLGGWWSDEARSERVLSLFRACMTTPGKLAPHRLLVLRGIEDEAGLTLAFGAFGAKLSYVLAALSSRILSRFRTIAVLTVIAIVTALYVQGAPGPATRIALVLLAVPFALVAIGSLLCVLCRSVHGRELVAGGLLCEVGSTAAPDSVASAVTVATLPIQMEHGLSVRHSLYDNIFCGRAIEAWLTELLGNSKIETDKLPYLVDFLHESAGEGLHGLFLHTNRALEDMKRRDAEQADVARTQLETDEELAQEVEEAERILKRSQPG